MSRPHARTPRTIRVGPHAYPVRYLRGRLFYKDEGDPGPREYLFLVDHQERVITATAHVPPRLRPVVEFYAQWSANRSYVEKPGRARGRAA